MDDLEFIEEGHLYLKSGVIIPSVSEILHFIFPDKYKNVDEKILNKKAKYGSIVHEAIECIEQQISISQYKRLKEKYNIKVKAQEQMINYKNEYAGRFDMIANVGEYNALCDIKTTAILDKEYLSWQLSLYELAYRYLYHTSPFEKLYAIWLPKKKYGELVEIKRKSFKEILEVLKEFKKSKEVLV